MMEAVTQAVPDTASVAMVTTNRLKGVRSNRPRNSIFALVKKAMNGKARSVNTSSNGTRRSTAYSAV